MKLNADCVRDLLLYLEENLSYSNSYICINDIKLNTYNKDDLVYTSEKLIEAEYIDGRIIGDGYPPIVVITDISFEGHQFLNTVRDNTIWKKTKSKVSKYASFSIPILQDVAVAITKNLIGLP